MYVHINLKNACIFILAAVESFVGMCTYVHAKHVHACMRTSYIQARIIRRLEQPSKSTRTQRKALPGAESHVHSVSVPDVSAAESDRRSQETPAGARTCM